MKPLISIIIPVYNVEKYLDRCLESIAGQTYTHWEAILVDDESPDACPRMCDAWAEKDSRIKVIHKKNAGPGYARNSGLDMAAGDYVTFVDSDDYLSADALEVMIARAEQDRSDMVIAQFARVLPDGTQLPSGYHVLTNRILTQEEALGLVGAPHSLPDYLWAKLYRRAVFQEQRFTAMSCAEDVYAVPGILERCDRVSLVENVLYFYFQRDNSIVHQKKRKQIMDSISAALYVSRYLFDKGYVGGASRYYYSAVCQGYGLCRDREAGELLKKAYTRKEKKILKKKMDRSMRRSVIAAKHSALYAVLKRLRGR